MPVLILIATLLVVIIGWNSRDGLPLSEKYRQDIEVKMY